MSDAPVYRLFVCYAHSDASFLREIETHLKPLTGEEGLALWSDKQIEAGADWEQRINTALTGADAAIVLVSAEALASNYIMTKELPVIEARHKEGLAVYVINVSASLAADHPFLGRLQWVNKPEEPLSELTKPLRDRRLSEFARQLRGRLNVAPKSVSIDSGATPPIGENGPVTRLSPPQTTSISETFFRGQTISLPAIVANLDPKQPAVLSGYYFEDCEIIGPAALILQTSKLEGCTFGAPVGPDGRNIPAAMFLRPNHSHLVMGCVILEHCILKNCTLENIAFVGGDALINAVLQGTSQ